jgi:hypothetical protein
MTATTTPTVFTHADYIQLEHVFAGGDISKATKADSNVLPSCYLVQTHILSSGRLVFLRRVKPSELS